MQVNINVAGERPSNGLADRQVAEMRALLRLMSGSDARSALATLLASLPATAGKSPGKFGAVRPLG